AYLAKLARHCSGVTPVWASHALRKLVATVAGSAAPGLVNGGEGLSGMRRLSFPAVGSMLSMGDGPIAGPYVVARYDPAAPRMIPTTASTSTASTSAIPYRVPSSRRIRRMSPHRGALVDSGRRAGRAGTMTSPESGR